MDILRRDLAPIPQEAWEEIEETAQANLKACLSGRRFVDVIGPLGWDYAAIPLGRLEKTSQKKDEVGYGVRTVQPLVEARIIFELDSWELDNASRGAEDLQLDPLEEAARKIATFEEQAIYQGFDPGQISGLRKSSTHKAIKVKGDPSNLLEAVAQGITEFTRSAVEGPYLLVAGSNLWQAISEHGQCYPLKQSLERLLENSIILNPFLQETFLVSSRGGDMRLTLGQDLSIGYHAHTTEKVELYFTESFTFRVLDGSAIIPIEWQEK